MSKILPQFFKKIIFFLWFILSYEIIFPFLNETYKQVAFYLKIQVYTCHDRDHTQPLYHCVPTTPQWHNSKLRNLPENNATMTSVEVDPCGLSHLWKDYLCVWFRNLKSTGQVDSRRQNSTGGARTPQRWTKTYVFFVVSDTSDWVFAWYRAEAGALSHGNKHTQLTK